MASPEAAGPDPVQRVARHRPRSAGGGASGARFGLRPAPPTRTALGAASSPGAGRTAAQLLATAPTRVVRYLEQSTVELMEELALLNDRVHVLGLDGCVLIDLKRLT